MLAATPLKYIYESFWYIVPLVNDCSIGYPAREARFPHGGLKLDFFGGTSYIREKFWSPGTKVPKHASSQI